MGLVIAVREGGEEGRVEEGATIGVRALGGVTAWREGGGD